MKFQKLLAKSKFSLLALRKSCEQQKTTVLKIRKGQPICNTLRIPKCKATDEAKPVEICSFSGESKEIALEAMLFEAEMIKRCDTHYTTKCRPGYGYKPHCVSTPIQNCYDVPILKRKNVPINVRSNHLFI